ncbi:MAG: IS1634 family transposase [Candidatus Desulfatibia sp.]|uniref:IS1634 family transposase n=1 Tax=Candidatus Desulfatibia sp. TaxID=3101189 RepID=UPI002F2CBCBF
MFIRKKQTKNKKTGNVYTKHELVESYHTADGPRQRTIMQLGRLDLPKKHWPVMAKELERRLAGNSNQEQLSFIPENKTKAILKLENTVQTLADKAMNNYHALKRHSTTDFPESQLQSQLPTNNNDNESAEMSDSAVESADGALFKMVDCNSLITTCSRSFGPELVGHHVWKQLRFTDVLNKCGFSSREVSLSEAVIVGRLVRPSSDLSTWKWIRENSAISELTRTPLIRIKKDAVYEISEEILRHKKTIEQHLLKREQKLFPDRQSLYLFDLTNFYMEGSCTKNSLAAFGKSKEKRNDLRLVSLALMVDSDGFPVTSRVYQGNIGEPATLKDIMEDMGYLNPNGQLEFASVKPILVMDRGIATTENIQLIKGYQFPYIVVERAPIHKEYASSFSEYQDKFEPIIRKGQKEVWIHKVTGSDDKTSRILCVSEGRKAKEKAIADRWVDRAANDLERFRSSILKGNIKAIDKVYQRLGRIKGRYKGFNKRFSEKIEIDTEGKKAVNLSWKIVEADPEEKETLFGCYVIETDQINLDAKKIWHLYMTLTRVEAAFQSLKTDIGTRPIFHQLAKRTEAHILVSILAYHLLITIEYQLSRHGDNRSWKTIRTILETHRRETIIFTDKDKIINHIRQSGQPEPSHVDIYRKLKIKDPLKRNHYIAGRRT